MKDYKKLNIFYFLYLGGLGAYYTFLSVYLERELGYSGTQIGLVLAIAPIIAFFSSPIFGFITDIYKKPKLVIQFILLVGSILLLSTYFMAGTVAVYFIFAFEFFKSPIMPLTDSYTIKLGNIKGFYYSPIRTWGSLGYIVGSLVIGYLVSDKLALLFIFAGILYFISLLVFNSVEKIEYAEEHGSYKEDFFNLIKRVDFLLLLVILASTYAISNAMNNYNGIRILELGGTYKQIGYSTLSLAFFELIILSQNYKLLRKYGYIKLFTVASLALALRWLLYFFTTNVWVYLLSTSLHGISFALVFPAALTYISKNFPKKINATAFSLANSSYLITVSVFGFLIGYFYDSIGFKPIYIGMMTLSLLTLITIYLFKIKKA